MLTDVGCVRDVNEDVVAYSLPGRTGLTEQDMLALVADGMGGHAAGEVASGIAGDTVLRLYHESKGTPAERLAICLSAANRAIYEQSQSDPACSGMGTTCTVLAVRDNAVFLGHIGDSRAYLMREGRIQQISEDHSLVAQLVRDGALTEEEAMHSPDRNVVLRALGIDARANPTVWREGLPLLADDVLLLCSDGLSDVVEDKRIEEVLGALPPFEACQSLIDAALAAGGPDNVSVGVFALATNPAQAERARATRPLPALVDGGSR